MAFLKTLKKSIIAQPEPFEEFEAKLKTILPADYVDCYEDVQPVSMGSAGLKYREDGRVAWDEIWGSFCDLAMAGGPPHKGTLLEPASAAQIESDESNHAAVVREICRGVNMVAELPASPSPVLGWVRVDCMSDTMAEWLTRAIVMENVSARCEGASIDLPAGPNYRIEKEIKNVITAIAKTGHYWLGHMWSAQQKKIAKLFGQIRTFSPLVQPALAGERDRAADLHALGATIAAGIQPATGFTKSQHSYLNWVGVECPSVNAAVWLMRALVVSPILSRREGAVLFLPIDPQTDPNGETVIRSVLQMHAFAAAKKVF